MEVQSLQKYIGRVGGGGLVDNSVWHRCFADSHVLFGRSLSFLLVDENGRDTRHTR